MLYIRKTLLYLQRDFIIKPRHKYTKKYDKATTH